MFSAALSETVTFYLVILAYRCGPANRYESKLSVLNAQLEAAPKQEDVKWYALTVTCLMMCFRC